MKPRRHFHLLAAIGLIAGLLPATIGTVIEAMTAGSIEGQEDWSGGTIPISASVDQILDQSGLNQRTGTGAWRISNNTSFGNHNGAFSGWVFGPGLPVSAGQPSSGAGANRFTATLWFRSASAAADGSNIEIDLGTVPGDDRNTFLALTNRADADGGLVLRASEPEGATGTFRPTAIIATGITRSVWHRLDIVANFPDGSANDTVAYALDGVALANPAGGMTFGTFEGWRDGNSFPYALSNRLFFRSGATPSAVGVAFVDTAAQGFYFDDLFYAVANQSAPAFSLAAYATGFEPGFFGGSIQGQESWSGGTIPIVATVDQNVDQPGLNQRTGTGAWRISNNTSFGNHNGAFSGWVFGPGLPVSAGQPSSGAGADRFTATLWFRSASAAADGSNIEIDLGTVPGDDRNTFLALTNRADADGGLVLRASEPEGATGTFRPTAIIATGITRSVWHRLDIVANFPDGSANDTVAYALDGVALANPAGGMTFGTFEGWRDGNSFPYALSNRLFFRSGATPSAVGVAFVDTAAQGFYFDDLFYAVANQSAPAFWLAAYATGFEPDPVPAPDLTVSKTHAGNFIQGQIGAQFTVTVTNSGTHSTIGEVILTDDVPPGLTPTAASGAGWMCTVAGATITCTQSDALAPAASYPPVTLTVNVAPNAPASLTNTATISGGGDVNTTNDTATDIATINPPGPPDLIISKSHAGNFTQGQTGATYTIIATNSGGSPTGGVVSLVDSFPAGLTPTAASGAGWICTVAGATVTCSRSDALAAGASYAPITITVNVAASAPPSVTNIATISGGGDVNTTNDTATDVATINPPGPDLIISKTHAGNFTQGQTGATYTIIATNSGGSPTGGAVSLIDSFPAGLTPTAASGAGWICTVAGATITCTQSDVLAPAASYPPVTLTVNVAPNAPASLTNIATISGGGDVNTENDTATDVATILPGASQVDLAVTKTDGLTAYTPGMAVSYTITVTNAGPATADGFSIADNVPATITGVTVKCVVTGTGHCGTNGSSGNSVSFTTASLSPGAGNVLTLTVVGSVSASASGALVNTVTVAAGAGATDPNPGNNSATDSDTSDEGTGVMTEVASFFAYDPAFPGGVSVAAGDVTGDGVADIITGPGPGGGPQVRVFSLAGGMPTEVASFFAYDPAFPGGVSVAVGDVTGDGIADIITGPGAGGGPHVRVFSLAGGMPTEVASFFAYDPAFPGGISVAAGDVTGDGVAEVITGAGPGGGPQVRAFSLAGGTPTEVANFYAFAPAFAGGISVGAGDVTGDGVAEVITGVGPGGGPQVRAFSLAGGTPTEVANFYAFAPAFTGGVHVATADLTGDGVAEIITGAGAGGGPQVRAFSLAGGTPTEVANFYAYAPAFAGGISVAGQDLTGDGVADILTGAGPGGGPHVRVLDVSGVTVK